MSPRTRFLAAIFAAALAWAPAQLAAADTSITASNESEDSEVESGDVEATNSSSGFAGHQGGGSNQVGAQDIESDQATNVQEGDNDVDGEQNATARSGDGVGGQVLGGVSSGELSVDATNRTSDVDVETGDATAENSFAAFVGLHAGSDTVVDAADIFSGSAANVQEGDNEADVSQDSLAETGDAVGGQVFGAVSSGASDVVLANTSEDSDATSGDADQNSTSTTFSGLAAAGIIRV